MKIVDFSEESLYMQQTNRDNETERVLKTNAIS